MGWAALGGYGLRFKCFLLALFLLGLRPLEFRVCWLLCANAHGSDCCRLSPPEAWSCLQGPPKKQSFSLLMLQSSAASKPTISCLAYANAGKTTPNLSEPSRTLQSVICCVFGDPGTSLTVFVGLLKVLVDGWNKSKNNKRGVNTGLLWTSWDTPKQQVLKHMLKTINGVSIQVSYGPPETPQTNKNK